MRVDKAKSLKTSILDAVEAFPLNEYTTEDRTDPTGDSMVFEDATGS